MFRYGITHVHSEDPLVASFTRTLSSLVGPDPDNQFEECIRFASSYSVSILTFEHFSQNQARVVGLDEKEEYVTVPRSLFLGMRNPRDVDEAIAL